MNITKQRTLDYVEFEWGAYVERFNRLPKDEQNKRVRETGFETFHDLLAHILAWWEKGMDIIHAIAQERPFEQSNLDLDTFNAEAVARYKSWNESEFMDHFEKTRQKMGADLKSMDETVFENPHVKDWVYWVILNHSHEHLLTLSRFLTLDRLENDWSAYIADFNALTPQEQKEFLAQQGWSSFRDLIAHIVGWWEEGARVSNGILNSPAFTWQESETDAFNRELTRKFSTWSDEDLFKHYESVRLALIELVAGLPEDAFLNKDIESSLAAEIVRHYDDHPISHK